MLDDRLLEQCLPGEVRNPARGEPEVLHAGLGGAGYSELVLHAEREDRYRVLLGRHLPDRVAGGLADAVRTVAAEQHPVPIFAVGMGDEFGISGTGEACMEHFGLTASGIADRAREALLLKPIVSRAPLFGPEWT